MGEVDLGATSGDGATWAALAAAAPELAERIRARFAANRHHVLGTIRASGAPRLSGTEVAFEGDEVAIGMMPDSEKLRDVRRDPRVELHSAPLEDDLAEGDAKLAGVLVEVSHGPDGSPPGAFFRLTITMGSLVQVDGDELLFTTWRPDRGVATARRK